MYSIDKLKKEPLKELKKIAGNLKVIFTSKVKKDDLIKLILNSQKKQDQKLNDQKKEVLKDNSSTKSTLQNNSNKKPNFDNIPDLPGVYGKDKIVFLVRDPFWGFVYWEITEQKAIEFNLSNANKLLRVYDISNSGTADKPDSFFDIQINNDTNNWYIKFPSSNHTYIIDYGYIANGQFITVLRSNAATTPRDDVSDQVDQEWMLTDDQFRLIMQASGADAIFDQQGSQELMKFIAGNTEENMSSGGASITSPIGPYGDK